MSRRHIWALTLALLSACGSSHNRPPLDGGIDASPADSGVAGDATPDTAIDIDGSTGMDGGTVTYDFSWESKGEAPQDGYGSQRIRRLSANRAIWLGGSDWFKIGTDSIRVFSGASSSWADLGNTTTLSGVPLFALNANGSGTVLASGDVLFAGSGNQDRDRHATDEGAYSDLTLIFHTADESLTLAAPLPARRAFHGAALLPDGRVLVIGGATTPDTPINPDASPLRFVLTIEDSTLYYDPSADAWSDGPPMAEARYEPGVSVLSGGDVLVVGGFDARNIPLRSAERYHVSTGTWTTVASPRDRRAWHVQALLPSGKVLVAGGVDAMGNALGTAEVYDPEADTWSPAADLPLPVALAAGLTLETGDVMVTGGFQEGATKVAIGQVVAYREADDTWLPLPSLLTPRFYHSAVQLEDGRVLVAAGLRNDTEVMHGARDTEITSVPLR